MSTSYQMSGQMVNTDTSVRPPVFLPSSVALDTRLADADYRLLSVMLAHTRPDSLLTDVRQDYLAVLLRWSVAKVRRIQEHLRDLGYIVLNGRIRRDGKLAENVYLIQAIPHADSNRSNLSASEDIADINSSSASARSEEGSGYRSNMSGDSESNKSTDREVDGLAPFAESGAIAQFQALDSTHINSSSQSIYKENNIDGALASAQNRAVDRIHILDRLLSRGVDEAMAHALIKFDVAECSKQLDNPWTIKAGKPGALVQAIYKRFKINTPIGEAGDGPAVRERLVAAANTDAGPREVPIVKTLADFGRPADRSRPSEARGIFDNLPAVPTDDEFRRALAMRDPGVARMVAARMLARSASFSAPVPDYG